MGAKPKKVGSAAKVPAKKKRAPARRVPARKAASKSGRTARDKTVDAYVAALHGEQAEAAQRLRQLIASAAPSAAESIKWGQPVYEENGPFCYFKASGEHIVLGFWRGTELEDPDGRLEGDGDRMKYINIHSADEIEEDVLTDWVRQAVDLNRRHGSPTVQGQETGQGPGMTGGGDGDDERAPQARLDDDDDDDGAYADMAQDGGEQATERYEDDESFEPSWKDGER